MNIIVAMCRNRGIGKNGVIPWALKEDMQFFKNKTIGSGNNAVIMGRKTFESLNRKDGLPKRDNYVISSRPLFDKHARKNCFLYNDIGNACSDIISRKDQYDDVWVIGGQQIYSWFLTNNLIKDVYITSIVLEADCDCFFPELSRKFTKLHSGDILCSKHKDLQYNIDVYRNKEYEKSGYNYDLLRRIDFIKTYGAL